MRAGCARAAAAQGQGGRLRVASAPLHLPRHSGPALFQFCLSWLISLCRHVGATRPLKHHPLDRPDTVVWRSTRAAGLGPVRRLAQVPRWRAGMPRPAGAAAGLSACRRFRSTCLLRSSFAAPSGDTGMAQARAWHRHGHAHATYVDHQLDALRRAKAGHKVICQPGACELNCTTRPFCCHADISKRLASARAAWSTSYTQVRHARRSMWDTASLGETLELEPPSLVLGRAGALGWEVYVLLDVLDQACVAAHLPPRPSCRTPRAHWRIGLCSSPLQGDAGAPQHGQTQSARARAWST